MNKKNFAFTAFLLAFSILICSYAYASSYSISGSSSVFDVSIDRVQVNGNVVSQSKNNLIRDADVFSIVIDFTTLGTLEKGHVEAILRGRQSGEVVSNSTGIFDLPKNTSSTSTLKLALADALKRETEFDLTIKIADARDHSEQRTFGIITKSSRIRGALDVSIDRVKINDNVVAASKTNFIEKNDKLNALVEFTALEDLRDAHVEAVLRDLNSGNVIADATPNFDLSDGLSSSRVLNLKLFDVIKKSNSFELAVKIINAEGDFIQKTFLINFDRAAGRDLRQLDISIDSVELEKKVIAENEENIIVIGQSQKEADLTVRMTSLENIKNAHIDAVLTFENGDAVAGATANFDLAKNESAAKTLRLPLLSKFEQNTFRLKVKITDAEGDSEEKEYGLKISKSKFPFIISSVFLSPEENAEAGKNMEVVLIFKNKGFIPLDGITAKVSIPEIGVSSAKFISPSKNNLAEIKEEFMLKIPDNTPAGTYTLRSEILSPFESASEVKEIAFSIAGKDEQLKQAVNDRLAINIPVLKQELFKDGAEAAYPITLKNEGANSNTYIMLLDGLGWADLRLTESNIFVIKPKESKTINVLASTKNRPSDNQFFFVTIKKDDKVLKQIQLSGNVIAAESASAAQLGDVMAISIAGLLIAIFGAGVFFAIRKFMQKAGTEAMPQEMPLEPEGGVYYGEDIAPEMPIEPEVGDYYKNNISSEIPDAAEGDAYY